MDLSDLIVHQVVEVNRVKREVGIHTVRERQYCILCYKVTGKSVYMHQDMTYLSDSSHIVFIPSGATYQYQCQERGECIILGFHCNGQEQQLQSLAVNSSADILATLERIERAYTFKKAGYKAYCLSGVYRLLYDIVSQNENRYLAGLKKQKIQPGLEYLEKHYQDSALDVQTLAERSGVSEVYFRKLFTEIYGMPPKKYINLIRLSKAKELLLTGEVTVQQVAEATGFRDVYSFCKSFRKTYECTPTEYRKSRWG